MNVRIETRAREVALQAVYMHDLVGSRTPEELHAFCTELAPAEVARMAIEFVEGSIEHQEELDEVIGKTAENWELARMATSDRNILRLGAYELLFRPETPPKVAINEAIELAKKFGTGNSATFVNGVLDRIYSTRVLVQADEGGVAPERPMADPEAKADLHVHSTASDGSCAPEELPPMAAKAGLQAFALTDHDSLEGIAAAQASAEQVGVELIPGVELTAYQSCLAGEGDIELHVAGLFVDPACMALQARLSTLREARVERVRLIGRKLHELGVELDVEAIVSQSDSKAVGRAHIAQQMVERGCCRDVGEAFARYIGPGCPAYVPKDIMGPEECIRLVHEAGGCAVLCHPALIESYELYVEQLVDLGLDGIEIYYPGHTAEARRRLLDLARSHDLAVTGGSDFHGAVKPQVGLGQETISFVELEKLRDRCTSRA